MTQQLYFDDVYCLEFQAEVTEIFPGEDGNVLVLLPCTYFYPTSGGQDHDIGKIGDAIVLDVYKRPDNEIIHVLDRKIVPGSYPASIDPVRRRQNMQSHTAQHILSRAFEIDLNMETLSANINFENPSTIDLDSENLLDKDIEKVEMIANSIIFENRQVKNYFITDEDISKIPFRKPPKVSGKIRVIEVDGFDYSACGGTHCPHTGMVGLIKILKHEVQNHKIRIHFVAGTQAMKVFQAVYQTVKNISGVMDTSINDLEISVQRQSEILYQLRSQLETFKSKLLTIEATQLINSAAPVGNMRMIKKLYSENSPEDLRKLVNMIRSQKGFLIILAGLDGKKLSMVVGCSVDLNLDARKILNLQLEKFNGHGGGDEHLAQGGCILSDKIEDDVFNDMDNMNLFNFQINHNDAVKGINT